MNLPPPFRLEAHGEVESTNDIVQARARAGEAEGLVVTASAQKSGRGRLGRNWSSPPGNLYCSFLLRPVPVTGSHPGSLSLVTGLALAEAIGERATLKWPNDVLINGAKTAGILLELQDEALIVGMGINILHAPDGTPYPATSLAAQGIDLDADELLHRFFSRFAVHYAVWLEAGFVALRDRWLDRASGIGTRIRLRRGEQILEGRFLALAADGSIAIEHEGRINHHLAGELLWHAGHDRNS